MTRHGSNVCATKRQLGFVWHPPATVYGQQQADVRTRRQGVLPVNSFPDHRYLRSNRHDLCLVSVYTRLYFTGPDLQSATVYWQLASLRIPWTSSWSDQWRVTSDVHFILFYFLFLFGLLFFSVFHGVSNMSHQSGKCHSHYPRMRTNNNNKIKQQTLNFQSESLPQWDDLTLQTEWLTFWS